MKGLLLIPALNEELAIGQIVREATEFIPDIFVVDDGSVDATKAASSSAGAIVHRLENMGKGKALKVGFRYTLERNYDWVVTKAARQGFRIRHGRIKTIYALK